MPFLADKTYIILTTMSKHHTSDCMSFWKQQWSCHSRGKIYRGKCKLMGDVDCWGTHKNNTTRKKKNVFREELSFVLHKLEERRLETNHFTTEGAYFLLEEYMFMSQLVWSNILFLSINKTNQVWKNTPQKMLSKIYIKKKGQKNNQEVLEVQI